MPKAVQNSSGTYDVYDTGGTKVGTGTADWAKAQGANIGVPSISGTPPVISSKDLSSSFAANSSSLTEKTTPQTFTTPSGAVVDANGNLISGPPNTQTQTQDQSKTPIEKGAGSGAGSGDQPQVTTGDPIYDSLQAWEQKQSAKAEQDAVDKKAMVASNLKTNLANTDAAYASQITSIQHTFAGLIDTQTRISNLDIARTKAYGLSSGNAMSTPLEFTNAVSLKEQDAMTSIQKLDNQRDDLIAQAKNAMAIADAKLMQDSMDQIDKIETNMRTTAAEVAKEVTDRFDTLQKIEVQQKAELEKQKQAYLASASLQYVDLFGNETDPGKKDAMVKQIVNASGGLADYGTVLSTLSGAWQAKQDTAMKQSKDKADLAKTLTDIEKVPGDIARTAAETAASKASAASSQANTAKTYQEIANMKKGLKPDGTPPTGGANGSYGMINKLLVPGVKMKDGTPYLAPDGKITSAGFDTLVAAAKEDGVKRAEFLKEYGAYLQPGIKNDYSQYNLTQAEKDTLSNTGKAANLTINTNGGSQ